MKTSTTYAMIVTMAVLAFNAQVWAQCVQCSGGTATGASASIIGINNTASGIASFAGGEESEATGDYSIAFGKDAKASGMSSIALGMNTEASGMYSVAMPFFAKSTGERSLAFGYYAVANGAGSLALGSYASTGASGLLSIAIGSRVSSDMTNSMVLGFGHTSAILINDVEKSLMVGFNSNKPTFFVGPASGIDKTGKVGIGNITSPTAKLHIRADDNEHASLKLEPTGTGKLAMITLGNNGHEITARENGDLKFTTQEGRNFVYESGNMGIGTSDPVARLQIANGDIFIENIDRGIIMKSPDGNCWRGTLNNSGMLEFTQVDCNGLVTAATTPGEPSMQKVQIYPNPAGDRVFVSIQESLTGSLLEITDVNGKIITTETLHNPDQFIDLSSYKAGLYIFRVKDHKGSEIDAVKIVKN
jgi:hypothetical protein